MTASNIDDDFSRESMLWLAQTIHSTLKEIHERQEELHAMLAGGKPEPRMVPRGCD